MNRALRTSAGPAEQDGTATRRARMWIGRCLPCAGRRCLVAVVAAVLASAAWPTEEPRYQAEIRRTAYGVPHIKANDWGGLGYGYGYAYAQDNFCVAMRGIVFASSRSAEFFGEGEGDVQADFVLRLMFGSKDEFARQHLPAADRPARHLLAGFAAGMNRYLRETGVAGLPAGADGCRDAAWVYPIDEVDVWMLAARLALQGSSDQEIVRDAIYAASSPSLAAPAAATVHGVDNADWNLLERDLRRLGQQLGNAEQGSNAIAIGRDLSRNGRGLLLANPHRPWRGTGSFYQVHLTIPGVYDVAGASLQGVPFVGIGFNRDVAWTHTISFATRFTLYELRLRANGQRYLYDGQLRAIEERPVAVRVKRDDGVVETRRRIFRLSHFGPMVDLSSVNPLLGLMTVAIRDANAGRYAAMVEQYLRMGQATDMATFTESLQGIGVPVFHTLAADRGGMAFYGEVSAVPHLSTRQLDRCINSLLAIILRLQTNNAALALDGSISGCEWGAAADDSASGSLYDYAARPTVLTTDYVANGNDSYWLSNAANPLTGYPVLFGFLGHEGRQQQLRTRLGHLMIAERRRASDGLDANPGFTLATLEGLLYRHRVYAAELVLADVLRICEMAAATPVVATVRARAALACEALGRWDRRADLQSRGAQVFTEFWRGVRERLSNFFTSVVGSPTFWAVDFNPADPLNTPRGIDVGHAGNRELVLQALSDAVLALESANVPLDAPWASVQFDARDVAVADSASEVPAVSSTPLPIHGGDGNMGVYAAIQADLRAGGYTGIRSGNSYMQAVTWDDTECPLADTVLAQSQSSNPSSPHYRDQTALYSRKEWLRLPFCEAQIAAAQVGETLTVSE